MEVNRPGQKGFRTPASKKKAKDEAKAQVGDTNFPTHQDCSQLSMLKLQQQEAIENGNDSPSQPAEKKKRARVKKEPDVEDGDEPAPKKAKAATRKGKKVKTEEDVDEEPQPKKDRKKTSKSKVESGSGQVVKAQVDDENVAPSPPKKQRAPRKAAPRKIKSEDSDDEDDEPMLAPKGDDESFEVEGSGEDIPKIRRGRKPSTTKDKNDSAAMSKPAAKPRQKVVLHDRCQKKRLTCQTRKP